MSEKIKYERRGIDQLPKWVISDTHFRHFNIISYCHRPWDCDERMLSSWRALVGSQDEILHLGDVCFSKEFVDSTIKNLPGQVSFLAGNHDKKLFHYLQDSASWELVVPFTVEIGIWTVVFSHHPLEWPLPAKTISVHGHIHNRTERSAYHINLSADATDFSPVEIRSVLEQRIKVLSSPKLLEAHNQDLERRHAEEPPRLTREEQLAQAKILRLRMRSQGFEV